MTAGRMERGDEGTRRSALFHLLLAVHCSITILIDSMVPVTGTMVKCARAGILLGLLFLILFRHEYLGIRYIAFCTVTGVLFALAAVRSGGSVLLISALFILAAKGEDFREICRTYLVAAGGTVLVVVALCLVGILEDYTYPHGSAFAHGLGFEYYSTLPFLLFILQMVWMYVQQEKVRWWELAVCCAANVVYYRLFTVRLTFLLGILMVVMFVPMVKLKWEIFNPARLWVKVIAGIAYGILLAVILYISAAYNPDSLSWLAWNTRFNNRLVMLHEAYQRYAIPLFGNKFEMVGQTFVINGGAMSRDYFYIDSGIGYSVFAYGLLFTIFIVLLLTYLYLSCAGTGDRMLYIWLSILLLFTFMNNIWIDLAYNPLLLAVVPVMEKQGILHRAFSSFREEQIF